MEEIEAVVKVVGVEGQTWTMGKLSSALGAPGHWMPIIERAITEGRIELHGGWLRVVSHEDAEARAEAMKFADRHTPMALEAPGSESPPSAEIAQGVQGWPHDAELCGKDSCTHGLEPQKKRRRTPEERAADKTAKEAERAMARLHAEALRLEAARDRAIEKEAAKAAKVLDREQAKIERKRIQAQAKVDAARQKITDAEGGHVDLPAVVFRNGTVRHVSDQDAWVVMEMYLGDLCLDCETSGYPLGHKLYELKTAQLGGEEAAVVFDASDPAQMTIVALALSLSSKLRAYSAIADVIPLVHAGVIAWEAIWAKMYDAVFNAKLTDPKMSGSDADALKELSVQVLGDYAVSREAEIAKNALFKAMGCLTDTTLTTEPERNGWLRVNKNSVVMTRYAGSDVLDLAAVIRKLPPIPVSQAVVEREREFQDSCARVNLDGFPLDHEHIKMKITEEEASKAQAQQDVLVLSNGLITNPKSPDVIKLLPQVIPGLVMPVNRKSKNPSADKEALEKLAREYPADTAPEAHFLFKRILAYRHHDTTLGLLLRPLNELCEHGDGRGRPTVYTIEASTGRTSCRRFNGQQMSRQGGVRACITSDPGYLGITADFQGCEICVTAALSGDQGLYEAETGTRCHRCKEDACVCGGEHTGLHWLLAHTAFGEDATKENRYNCKRGIFCKFFGGGAETAAAQVGCPTHVMERVFEAVTEVAPDFTAWDLWMRDCYKQGSMVWRDYTTGQNYSVPIDGANRLVYQTYSGRNVYATNGAHAAGNCITPDTLILTDDLRHVTADSVKAGDQLVAFDEYPGDSGSGNKYHRMRRATVLYTASVVKQSVTVTTADGKNTVCSADHRWLVRRAKAPHRGPRIAWAEAATLLPGDALLSLGTWEADSSYESGYLAGLYDGEGCIEARGLGHKSTGLQFNQLPGSVLEEYERCMRKLGLPYNIRRRKQSSTTPTWAGQTTGIRDIMRVIGTIRPTRLMANALGARDLSQHVARVNHVRGKGVSFYEGAAITAGLSEPVAVTAVVPAGNRKLTLIQTDTRTFTANGYLSHNSAIQGTARELLVDGVLNWRQTKWGHLPLLPIHDEILTFVPEQEAQEATTVLAQCMQTDVLSSPGFPIRVGADVDAPFRSWPDSS